SPLSRCRYHCPISGFNCSSIVCPCAIDLTHRLRPLGPAKISALAADAYPTGREHRRSRSAGWIGRRSELLSENRNRPGGAMARRTSRMMPLGTAAPPFALRGTAANRTVGLESFAASPALLVAFICNHCPFVKHILDGFVSFAREFGERGLAVVAISP